MTLADKIYSALSKAQRPDRPDAFVIGLQEATMVRMELHDFSNSGLSHPSQDLSSYNGFQLLFCDEISCLIPVWKEPA